MRARPHSTCTGLRNCLTAALAAVSVVTGSNIRAADFFNGEKLYQKYCQSCHGINGQGVIGGAPNFARGQALMKPDFNLYETIDRGKNAMPAFRGVFKEEEYYDVITYIRSFY
jgi:mono/diheme cytochrome c family protein